VGHDAGDEGTGLVGAETAVPGRQPLVEHGETEAQRRLRLLRDAQHGVQREREDALLTFGERLQEAAIGVAVDAETRYRALQAAVGDPCPPAVQRMREGHLGNGESDAPAQLELPEER
jgi:hypothetical protein